MSTAALGQDTSGDGIYIAVNCRENLITPVRVWRLNKPTGTGHRYPLLQGLTL